jgi:hypothetical protein
VVHDDEVHAPRVRPIAHKYKQIDEYMAFSFAYDWNKFPAAWFGANATHFESPSQLDFIGKFSLAIFGWQHLISATNWTATVYSQLNQAAIVKARHPELPVFAYTGFANADGYNAATWDIIRTASDGCPNHQPCRKVAEPYTDWVLETDNGPVYSMSACEQMGLGYRDPPTDKCWNPIWNVANGKARDFFIERIIGPLAAAPMIDGVFFDCFNMAYQLPTPWNRKAINIPNCSTPDGGPGCEALLEGTIELALRVAQALNARGKVPIFSNVGSFANPHPGKPFWLDEARLLKGLQGTSFVRALWARSVRRKPVPLNLFRLFPMRCFASAHGTSPDRCPPDALPSARRCSTTSSCGRSSWPRRASCPTCSRSPGGRSP